jgi:predicted nucleic acid-binding protein
MKLLDTNVLVYARNPKSPWHQWAVQEIASLVNSEGAAFSAASLAELCGEDGITAADVPGEISNFGVDLLDIPSAAAVRCGEAYRSYRHQRKQQSGKEAPKMPLPDFFIGAHAELLGLDLVTNDPGRYKTYFPQVKLVIP